MDAGYKDSRFKWLYAAFPTHGHASGDTARVAAGEHVRYSGLLRGRRVGEPATAADSLCID